MQFKQVLPISNNPISGKKPSYQNRTPASIQKYHIQVFKASGLKQIEFCEQHNIPYGTFTNWLRRHHSDRVIPDKSIDQAQLMRVATQEDSLKTTGPIRTMTCTLPNTLSITINLGTLADLSDIIETLSQCKLN